MIKFRLGLLRPSAGGSITRAAEMAETHRSNHSRWLKESSEYQIAYNEAQESAVDLLESEAVRRATKGIKKFKFYRGEPIIDPETGKPYYELDYSDLLLIFLLKAARPEKYRDHQKVEITAPVETQQPYLGEAVRSLEDEELGRLVELIELKEQRLLEDQS